MKVSSNSWHYRLIDWLDFDHCRNLCAYFWEVVWCVFLVGAVFPVVGLICIALFTMPFWHMFSQNYLIVGVIIVGTIEVIGLTCLLYTVVKDRRENEIYEGKRKRPEPSLAHLWIKAKHDKICPLIEFRRPT